MTRFHAQLFMDEHGNITRIVPPGQKTLHAGPANDWAEGIEIAVTAGGKNPNLRSSPLNAEQQAALDKFYSDARKAGAYPRGVYGHSEVMPPPHRLNEGEYEARRLREMDASRNAPTAPVQPLPKPHGDKVMIFLHGMWSRYAVNNITIPGVEAEARRYAEARGYKLEVINVSGDDHAGQAKALRERLAKGDVGVITGFSAGAYTVYHANVPEGVEKVMIGADLPGALKFPGRHGQQPTALAQSVQSSDKARETIDKGPAVSKKADAKVDVTMHASAGFKKTEEKIPYVPVNISKEPQASKATPSGADAMRFRPM
jgi:hypothetical protein